MTLKRPVLITGRSFSFYEKTNNGTTHNVPSTDINLFDTV